MTNKLLQHHFHKNWEYDKRKVTNVIISNDRNFIRCIYGLASDYYVKIDNSFLHMNNNLYAISLDEYNLKMQFLNDDDLEDLLDDLSFYDIPNEESYISDNPIEFWNDFIKNKQ